MNLSVAIDIAVPTQDVWNAVTDIEGASERISAIESVEVLHKPASGLRGLKWSETRVMYGKSATEIMEICEVDDGRSYKTIAHNHGMKYESEIEVSPAASGSTLRMAFQGTAETFAAKVFSTILTPLFKSSLKKALAKDLADIKASLEKRS